MLELPYEGCFNVVFTVDFTDFEWQLVIKLLYRFNFLLSFVTPCGGTLVKKYGT